MQTLETVNLFFQDIQLTVYYEYSSIALTQIIRVWQVYLIQIR